MNAAPRGTLFLVVGPSGAGKDTLIAAAQRHLADDGRYLFARRVITRPAEVGGEDHEPADAAAFAALAAAGAFALDWSAHGLCYGLRREIATALAAGRHVVANVSRTVVASACARFAPVIVIVVDATPDTRARRLAARGREALADIAQRLAREGAALPPVGARRIDNSGDLAGAAEAFIAALDPAGAISAGPGSSG